MLNRGYESSHTCIKLYRSLADRLWSYDGKVMTSHILLRMQLFIHAQSPLYHVSKMGSPLRRNAIYETRCIGRYLMGFVHIATTVFCNKTLKYLTWTVRLKIELAQWFWLSNRSGISGRVHHNQFIVDACNTAKFCPSRRVAFKVNAYKCHVSQWRSIRAILYIWAQYR